MTQLKNFTPRKNGSRMKTRRVTVHLPEESVIEVMSQLRVSQKVAELMLIQAMVDPSVECCGLVINHVEERLTAADSGDDESDVTVIPTPIMDI